MNITLPGGVSVQRFRFLDRSFDIATGEARLTYSFDDGEPFFEHIRFPFQPWPAEPSRQAAFEKSLDLLHLVAGVSYYKACVPEQMDTGKHKLDKSLADFLRALYVRGLGEFAFRNGLTLESRVNFPVNSTGAGEAFSLDLPERALVAMGGGKDSLVSLEKLRAGGIKVQPICVGQSCLIASTVKAAGLPLIQVERTLSPALAKMNEAGAFNGHVPVTAINSVILLCASILYGYRWVVFSNESSAEEATRSDSDGRPVNHQYSKSLEFEKAFRGVIQERVSPGIEYFSLLRPLKELAVARSFSKLRNYHEVFSSCNRNFHLDGPRIGGRWCADCPKCRFTALALAPFTSPGALVSIMGVNLLDQPGQEEGYRALCRLGVEKPFECVGSIDESRAAMYRLGSMNEWKNAVIVRQLKTELRDLDIPEFESLLSERGEHCIPRRILQDVAV